MKAKTQVKAMSLGVKALSFELCVQISGKGSYPEIHVTNFKGEPLTTISLQKCECVVAFLLFSCKHLCTLAFGIRYFFASI